MTQAGTVVPNRTSTWDFLIVENLEASDTYLPKTPSVLLNDFHNLSMLFKARIPFYHQRSTGSSQSL